MLGLFKGPTALLTVCQIDSTAHKWWGVVQLRPGPCFQLSIHSSLGFCIWAWESTVPWLERMPFSYFPQVAISSFSCPGCPAAIEISHLGQVGFPLSQQSRMAGSLSASATLSSLWLFGVHLCTFSVHSLQYHQAISCTLLHIWHLKCWMCGFLGWQPCFCTPSLLVGKANEASSPQALVSVAQTWWLVTNLAFFSDTFN